MQFCQSSESDKLTAAWLACACVLTLPKRAGMSSGIIHGVFIWECGRTLSPLYIQWRTRVHPNWRLSREGARRKEEWVNGRLAAASYTRIVLHPALHMPIP